MNIGFIGAGKVGCTFGHYLKQQGLNVLGYYSLSKSSSELGAKLTDSSPLNFDELISKCNYIFITCPDQAIDKVWDRMKTYDLCHKNIFHMSGAKSLRLFSGYKGNFYSLHPIYSFNSRKAEDLSEVIFSISGDGIENIQDFLDRSKIKYFRIEDSQKVKYHAASVFMSNYLVALYKISQDLFLELGMDRDFVFLALAPLMYGSLDNIRLSGPEGALTGPISRGDLETVESHILEMGDYRNLYRELGLVALDITREKGSLEEGVLEDLENILRGGSNEKNS